MIGGGFVAQCGPLQDGDGGHDLSPGLPDQTSRLIEGVTVGAVDRENDDLPIGEDALDEDRLHVGRELLILLDLVFELQGARPEILVGRSDVREVVPQTLHEVLAENGRTHQHPDPEREEHRDYRDEVVSEIDQPDSP